VTLVANDVPAATREDLPEVLQFDRERLHAAQNGLQQLLVLAGGLLLVQQRVLYLHCWSGHCILL